MFTIKLVDMASYMDAIFANLVIAIHMWQWTLAQKATNYYTSQAETLQCVSLHCTNQIGSETRLQLKHPGGNDRCPPLHFGRCKSRLGVKVIYAIQFLPVSYYCQRRLSFKSGATMQQLGKRNGAIWKCKTRHFFVLKFIEDAFKLNMNILVGLEKTFWGCLRGFLTN